MQSLIDLDRVLALAREDEAGKPTDKMTQTCREEGKGRSDEDSRMCVEPGSGSGGEFGVDTQEIIKSLSLDENSFLLKEVNKLRKEIVVLKNTIFEQRIQLSNFENIDVNL